MVTLRQSTSWSNTQIVANVAPGAGMANAEVSQNGIASNGVPFYVPPPTITGASPTSGVPGTQVTVTGSGFGSSQGTNSIEIGSVAATVDSWSATQIVATVASGATPGQILVDMDGIDSNSIIFSMTPATVTSVSPSSGSGGTQVTVSGSGFGASQGSGYVVLGTLNAVVTSWSDSQIVATVASGSGAGFAKVYQNGVWSNALPFTSTPPTANITSISPSSGVPGTQVTVTGTGFGSSQGESDIELGNKWASVVSWTNTQIVATVAAGAEGGFAMVETSGGESNEVPFSMIPPTVTSVTPVILTVGSQVTINGSGFGATQGSYGHVYLGAEATQPTITSWSDSQILATVTSATTPGEAWVSQNGVSSSMMPITMTPATITGVTPSSGLATGTQITLSGSGFGSAAGNLYIGSEATQPTIQSWSNTQIVATVAAGTEPGNIWLKQNGVYSNSLPITLAAPAITSVSPVNGVAGTQVTINGSGFARAKGAEGLL